MRPSCLGAVSLLLLFIFLSSTVQGIRLEKSFKSAAGHPKVLLHEGGGVVKARNGVMKGDDDEAMIVCKEGQEHCSGKSTRKLFTATTSTTTKSTTTSKRKKNGDHESKANPTSREKAPAVGSPTSSRQQEDEVHDQYADTMDIAEMDYSPAKRKPPIHN